MLWLIHENFIIDWVAWIVRVNRYGVFHNLPIIRQAIGGATNDL